MVKRNGANPTIPFQHDVRELGGIAQFCHTKEEIPTAFSDEGLQKSVRESG